LKEKINEVGYCSCLAWSKKNCLKVAVSSEGRVSSGTTEWCSGRCSTGISL